MAKRIAKTFYCPTEFTLEVLGGKWKTVILCYLKERPCRYAELRKLTPALSDKMLTERLRDLTDAGLVARVKLPGGPSAHAYALTPKGKSLGSLLSHLYAWGVEHAKQFGVAVGEPLKAVESG
jgi:DNA-binding HxlR family transcriptional regulator